MILRTAAFIIAAFFAVNAMFAAPEQTKLGTKLDSVSYALGMNIGLNINQSVGQNIDITLEAMIEGLKAGFKNDNSVLTPEKAVEILKEMDKMLVEQRNAVSKVKVDSFFKANKLNEGVKETASGLQYKVIKEGTGKKPGPTSKVKVHYHGTLINGKVFDSSVDRGEPIEFPLDGVIKGWTEGLQLMKEGAKYIFYIPPSLGYGERGAGQTIPPNAILIFEVELLQIVQ